MRSGSWHVVVTAEVSVEARLYSWQAGRRGLFITPDITLYHIQYDITLNYLMVSTGYLNERESNDMCIYKHDQVYLDQTGI